MAIYIGYLLKFEIFTKIQKNRGFLPRKTISRGWSGYPVTAREPDFQSGNQILDLYGLSLDPALGPTLTGGAAGCHGFWLHTAPDGRSGYLVPGWLATY